MNMKKTKIVLGLLALALLPQVSAAYEVTSESAVRLNDNTVLFSITYKFGFLNRDLYMPYQTAREESVFSDKVSYGFYSEGALLETGAGPAIVLTDDKDVEVLDGQYYLPRGKNAEFTLVGVLRLDETAPRNALSMHIGNLPFTMVNGDTKTPGRVLPEELNAYRTDSITFNEAVTITTSPPVIHH